MNPKKQEAVWGFSTDSYKLCRTRKDVKSIFYVKGNIIPTIKGCNLGPWSFRNISIME